MYKQVNAEKLGDTWKQAWRLLEAGKSRAAYRLFYQAAQMGDATAQANLGYLIESGKFSWLDSASGMAWYRKAARKGDAVACHNIAINYRDKGKFRLAEIWFRKSILYGEADSAVLLLEMIANKDGNPQESLVELREVLVDALGSNQLSHVMARRAKKLLATKRWN